jgi:histidinol-phosphate phosphatase family protein
MTGGSPTPPDGRTRRISLVISGEHGRTLRETRSAIFLDRDGTIIRDVGYIRKVEDVALMPGAAGALRTAANRQRPVIVVTNQSGIARGLVTQDDYDAVTKRMNQLLSEFGAYVDAEYVCPHHPDFTGPCECRKPGIALYERAISEHGIDPVASTFIGDRWRDISPAKHYGARGILVPTDSTPPEEVELARAEMKVAASLQEAIDMALAT